MKCAAQEERQQQWSWVKWCFDCIFFSFYWAIYFFCSPSSPLFSPPLLPSPTIPMLPIYFLSFFLFFLKKARLCNSTITLSFLRGPIQCYCCCFVCFFSLVFEKGSCVLLHSPGWPGTYYVDQASPRLVILLPLCPEHLEDRSEPFFF